MVFIAFRAVCGIATHGAALGAAITLSIQSNIIARAAGMTGVLRRTFIAVEAAVSMFSLVAVNIIKEIRRGSVTLNANVGGVVAVSVFERDLFVRVHAL